MLARLRDRLRGREQLVRRGASQLRWKAAVLRHARRGVGLQTIAGAPAPRETVVIVCLWGRPHRLPAILESLAEQKDCPPLRLVVWNNDHRNDARYREEIARNGARGALSRVDFGTSRINLGGMARFLVARTVTTVGAPQPFLMIDDDQDLDERFVAETLRAAGPRVYAGVWAFRLGEGYWDRLEIEPGENATYVGTGGSVCDSALVHERGFFRGCPAKYGFVEDLWASSFAAERKWSMSKTSAELTFVDDDVNQYPRMVWLKAEFFEYLRDHHGYGSR